jgi:peptidoglycan-associated lipoprotein
MSQSAKILRALVAALALSMAAGCAQQASPPPEMAGTWYQIYFDTNSFVINTRGRMIVNNVAYIAASDGAMRVTVVGKTDRVGAPPANMALSKRRADAVRDSLIAAGVPAARIDTSWTGEGRQEVATADDAAEPRNRIVYVTVGKESF